MTTELNGKNGQFPELIADIGSAGQLQTAAAPASPIGQKVTAALRESLAWRPRAIDPKGFVAALNSSFQITEKDGHTEWRWTPRSYAVQADMGAVTGAQASIYSRAKAALDHAKPLVEGLYPLDPATDIDKAEAIRSLVIAEMQELIDELGMVGGPRLPRVDGLFATLLGISGFTRPQDTAGLFGKLRDQFGLTRERVNMVSEEQNLTNFLIVVDHFRALRESWNTLVTSDETGNQAFGTQLVLLSRSLAVIVESVQQVYQIMDAVLLGPADRQTIRLVLPQDSGNVTLTIAELLSWVERFAQEEAKRIIDEAGLAGVLSFRPTLTTLADLVEDAAELSEQTARRSGNGSQNGSGSSLPQNFGHVGVQTSLAELADHLHDARGIVDGLKREPAPVLKAISPNLSEPDEKALITMFGTNFSPDVGISAFLTTNDKIDHEAIQATNVMVLTEQQFIATFDTSDADPDTYNVFVRTEDGDIASLSRRYTIRGTQPALEVLGLNPGEGAPGETLSEVEVVGTGLAAGDQLVFNVDITATALEDDLGTLRTDLTISDSLNEGLYVVGVRKADNRSASGPATFRVRDSAQGLNVEEVAVREFDINGQPTVLDIIGEQLDGADIDGVDLGLGDKGRVIAIYKNKPNLLRVQVSIDPSAEGRDLQLSVRTRRFTKPSAPKQLPLPFQKIIHTSPLPVSIAIRLDSATFEPAEAPARYIITGTGAGLRRGLKVRVRGADGKWVDKEYETYADDGTFVTMQVSATPSAPPNEKWELEITDVTVQPERTVIASLHPKSKP